MRPLWARAKAQPDARPRVVVHAPDGTLGGWFDRLAVRPDLAVERVAADLPVSRADREARLVMIVGILPLSAPEEEALRARIRSMRAELAQTPLVVVLRGETDPGEVGDRLFGAGATDVVLLPGDAERLEDAVGQFAGVGARRFVRHRVRVAAKVIEGAREMDAQVENLSNGGVQMRMAAVPAVGAVLKLLLPLERRDQLACWGVVRNVAGSATNNAVVRLRFVGMHQQQRAQLEAFLDSLDPDTRSTEPADAIAGVRRFDAGALRALLAGPATVPDWLAGAIPAFSASEKRALGPPVASGLAAMWVQVAVARVRAVALSDALEKYDPSLDGEARLVRETVLGVLNGLARARVEFEGWARGRNDPDAIEVAVALTEVAGRLTRAVDARVPDLAAAWERSGGIASSEKDLGLSELTLRGFDRGRLRNRLVAALAGLMLGGVLVYLVAAMISRVYSR